MNVQHATFELAELRMRIDNELNCLSASLMDKMSMSGTPERTDVSDDDRASSAGELQERIALLGQLAAGLAGIDAEAIPERGAGYGSVVVGEELFSGRQHKYQLMLGSLVDIDAGQVSLSSPVGQALFGAEAGDVVEIELPHRRLRLRIVRVQTIDDVIGSGKLIATDA